MPACCSLKGLAPERTDSRRVIAAYTTVIIPRIRSQTGQLDCMPVLAADVLERTGFNLVKIRA